ncbi:MAG: hypothetical protein CMJ18_20155 [Phycisphaeraceae bacterium]|nr:hypothetical protein [Phycisphaeraceae bacterium]
MTRPRIDRAVPIAALAALIATGCGDDRDDRQTMPSRPVSVMALRLRDLPVDRSLTGSVTLYREEQLGFEVGGRVLLVKDVGIELRGPAFNEEGTMVRQGDPIARLETTRFSAQSKSLEAALSAAQENLAAAQAERKLARQTLDRQRLVLEDGAGSQQAVDTAQSAFDQASAHVQARRAAVAAAQERLRSGREDLTDTTLYAPFNGRITAVHTSQGAVVNPGKPIVTLTLMDPVIVRVEVSADDERMIRTGDRALIYPKDPAGDGAPIPVTAIVYEKSAVADERLRTFEIDLISRNLRRHIHDLLPELDGLPVVNEYIPVIREFQGEAGPLYVSARSVLREGDRTFVLRLPGVSFSASDGRAALGRHEPEKVEVTLGDQYTSVIRWTFRSVSDPGKLQEGDFLIEQPRLEYLDGIAIGRPQWLLRPGDLVPVRFTLADTPRGYYVPVGAVTEVGGAPAVYLVENGKARARAVTVHDAHGELRRIEGEGIAEGGTLVTGGVHYLSDDQPVTVTATRERP